MGILVTCPTCKKQKAASASECPHCGEENFGQPYMNTSEVWGCLVFPAILVIIIFILFVGVKSGSFKD